MSSLLLQLTDLCTAILAQRRQLPRACPIACSPGVRRHLGRNPRAQIRRDRERPPFRGVAGLQCERAVGALAVLSGVAYMRPDVRRTVLYLAPRQAPATLAHGV